MSLRHHLQKVSCVAAALVLCIGCSEQPTQVAEAPKPSPAANQAVQADPMGTDGARSVVLTATNPSSATEVISEFLDLIRRGDADRNSDRLLTTRARQELARIGHKLQPLGSPSAKFQVTRAEIVPDSPGSALVHSYWSEPIDEPAANESQSAYSTPLQVVWAVQWERAAWRISGLAIQIDPAGNPLVLDFENGEAMARYLRNEAVAQTPDETVSR